MQFVRIMVVGVFAVFCTLLSARSEDEPLAQFARPATIAFPEDNPYSPQAAALGRMLFFDTRLSQAQNMSCATCHNPSFGWETPTALAIGAMNVELDRHAPTVENLAEAEMLGWDGRFGSLEEQAGMPIEHPLEMATDLDGLIARLSSVSGYQEAFEIAFPETGLTFANIRRALATYERTLQSGWSPFDDWIAGDTGAISTEAARGFNLFIGEARCVQCHSGWAFTDHDLHDLGFDPEGSEQGTRAFKTPGLRNISLRAPYMHHGGIETLNEVIRHYIDARSSDLPEITLSEQDIDDLEAFLESLTAYDPHVSTPALPAQ